MINRQFLFLFAKSKPVKQEVNGTIMVPPLVFPALSIIYTDNLSGPKTHLTAAVAVLVNLSRVKFCHLGYFLKALENFRGDIVCF